MNSQPIRRQLIAFLAMMVSVGLVASAQDQTSSVVTITFTNKMQSEVELFWVDENGSEHLYGKLGPGKELSQQSYPGQRWRLRSNGVHLKDVDATNSPMTSVPIISPAQAAAQASKLRNWVATQSNRRFNETKPGQWVGFVAADTQAFTATRFTASRDDENGVVLNRQDGGYYLLSAKGLYQAAAGSADWTFVEAGSFSVPEASKGRMWVTTGDPQNGWHGVIGEDTQSKKWARMLHDGTGVDVWQFRSEDQDGVIISSLDNPTSMLLITKDTLYYPENEVWVPFASGQWKEGGTASQPAVASGNPAAAGMANGANPGWNTPAAATNNPTNNPTNNATYNAAMAVAAASTVGQQTGSRVTQQDAVAALKIHNDARQRVGVRPLTWSVQVAQSAQAYADQLAAQDPGDAMNHDPNLNSTPYGENLTWLSGGRGSAVIGSNDWLEERVIWEENRAGEVGHYTQMVWHDTKELGIGISTGASGSVYIVARYNRAGNVEQHAPYPGAKIFRP